MFEYLLLNSYFMVEVPCMLNNFESASYRNTNLGKLQIYDIHTQSQTHIRI